ncbi:glycosyltransferase [Neobacillus cucumis]|uniref:glycosyltransferase n=1 Tax=Neobacillus cucumis TaxID=1740721 RepID=UPI001966C354|nr:glycosyltransferase [Neobacillus cucumis]MBM7651851.1 glycosyltransferase involved in cell wall biosynthesis [Neobacillus cucumis]
MKKQLLFMLLNMNVGGTEKAFLNMLTEMPPEKYEITVLLLEESGGFLQYIPDYVDIEVIKGYKSIKKILNDPPHITAINLLKKGHLIKASILIFLTLLSKVTKERSQFFNYVLKDIPNIETNYDVAVAYAGPMDIISYFVINKIKAKKKIQWIHFDVTKIGFNQQFAAKIYKKFDKVFVVSNEGKNKLLNYLPSLNEKTDIFLNAISPSSIINMANAEEGFKDNFNGVRILTVGRLTKEKGQDLTIPILAKLKLAGYNVRWYCIGDGGARKEYEDLIKKHGLENDFILLGANPNPYPYMKQCDLYVQPSRHEGYCITLAEAKCFNKPIVSTNFTGAREQIINNQTGLIVNFDEIEMYNTIKKLLDDKGLRREIVKNSQIYINNNTTDIQKLINLVPN